MEMIFSIANYAICKDVLGIGKRLIIWVQGCRKRCKMCQTPEYQKIKVGIHNACFIKRLFNNAIKQGIQGVTISGGEPFLQAELILCISRLISEFNQRTDSNLDLLIYTGYKYEYLKGKHKEVMNYIDVLIDGPYIKELDDDKGLRGSSNQRIFFLSNRGKELSGQYLIMLNERMRKVVFNNGKFISIGLGI